jgi:hypothetical protein
MNNGSTVRQWRCRSTVTACTLAAAAALISVVLYAQGVGQCCYPGAGLPSWGLARINNRVGVGSVYWYKLTGAGIPVYVIDTGVRRTHQDFTPNQVQWIGNFCTVDPVTGNPTDLNADDVETGLQGHGTHNASLIGGQRYGVAKGVTIYALRGGECGSDALNSTASTYAVRWIRNNRTPPGVVNISFNWGPGVRDPNLLNEISAAISQGFVFTLATGCTDTHTNWGTTVPPAALVVGGTYMNDAANPDPFGPDLALFAPAHGIRAAGNVNDSWEYVDDPTGYCRDSYSAPHVAGIAAQYLQMYPSASPAQVRGAIIQASTMGVLSGVASGTPNRLAYSRFTDIEVSFQASTGHYVTAENGGGGDVNANRPAAGPWELFSVFDMNAGDLFDGDQIAFRTDAGYYLQAVGGGGGDFKAVGLNPNAWETLTIHTLNHSGGPVVDGDQVAFETVNHWFVSADGGGGGPVYARAQAIGPWETFTIHLYN